MKHVLSSYEVFCTAYVWQNLGQNSASYKVSSKFCLTIDFNTPSNDSRVGSIYYRTGEVLRPFEVAYQMSQMVKDTLYCSVNCFFMNIYFAFH